jgi:hypothetical protein
MSSKLNVHKVGKTNSEMNRIRIGWGDICLFFVNFILFSQKFKHLKQQKYKAGNSGPLKTTIRHQASNHQENMRDLGRCLGFQEQMQFHLLQTMTLENSQKKIIISKKKHTRRQKRGSIRCPRSVGDFRSNGKFCCFILQCDCWIIPSIIRWRIFAGGCFIWASIHQWGDRPFDKRRLTGRKG